MTAPPGSRDLRWVVFTDLDGTLLDARTYSAEPARLALAALAARGVPVVFCSSKTAAEQRPLRQELGLAAWPFIVENGSAVIVPESARLPVNDWPRVDGRENERIRVLGRPVGEVRAGVARAAAGARVHVTGYADLDVSTLAALTGLDRAAAERARLREFSETLVEHLPADKWAALDAAFAAEGLRCQHGGRFRTVTAASTDKGRAAKLVAALFAASANVPPTTVGLGDSANDRDLLAAVDRAYLIAGGEGATAALDIPNLRRIGRAGPRGWSEAIFEMITG